MSENIVTKQDILDYIRDHTFGLSRGIRWGASIGTHVSEELTRMVEACAIADSPTDKKPQVSP